jgi:hypothetical protein
MPQQHPSRHGPVRGAVSTLTGLALSILAVAVVAACGSAGSPVAAALGSVRHQDCTAVAAVLSDGPDPTADPVGYAEAQVLPLERLKIADAPVRRATDGLAAAYKAFISAGTAHSGHGAAAGSGSSTARTTATLHVSRAQVAPNKLCPHAAP